MSKRFLTASIVFSTACVWAGLALLGGRIHLPFADGKGGAAADRAFAPNQENRPASGSRPDRTAPGGVGRVEVSEVGPRADLPPADDAAQAPAGGVWRCTDARGRTSYSDHPCADGRARPVDTRDALRGWDGQRNLADASRRDAIRQPAAPVVQMPAIATGGGTTGDSTGSCAMLGQEIARLNALARQPLAGWQQDRIREELRALNDERGRLGCRTLD
ncbi:DUF4124 domain-containing protein [Derxia gummosa]|uniref:DUF4124 domain-containing protein n=1 Tax=Derxia gummosa DSM 723 TaxID=1121388 RepID=A0A8B6X6L8_9BURK|nr:DUF4124 domain-containing protein [Derxia gummosa]